MFILIVIVAVLVLIVIATIISSSMIISIIVITTITITTIIIITIIRIIIIRIIIIITITGSTANLRTNIMDFRGFDLSIILILRGGIPRPIGISPESLSQAILVGVMLAGGLGVDK